VAQYDPSNDELYALFEECGRDLLKFARTLIAQNAQHEMHAGVLHNRRDEHFNLLLGDDLG
jgi:GAF domain-containing protein